MAGKQIIGDPKLRHKEKEKINNKPNRPFYILTTYELKKLFIAYAAKTDFQMSLETPALDLLVCR
jgi:hypothetical protein